MHPSLRQNVSDEYIELTKPLPSDVFTPSCSLQLPQERFARPIASSLFSFSYSPPSGCLAPWTHVVLEFRASCDDELYDRIIGVWLDGVEILRTSTAEPTESAMFPKVRKDVTRYSSLLSRSNLTLTVMLENFVNNAFTGVCNVNISLLYYGENETTNSPSLEDRKYHRKLGFLTGKTVDRTEKEGTFGFKDEEFTITTINKSEKKSGLDDRSATESVENTRAISAFPVEVKKLGFISYRPGGGKRGLKGSQILYEKPADMIIPISGNNSNGFWFRIQNESDVYTREIQIPLNTHRAVLEVYVSFHGNDEFWYSNPPDAYFKKNNLTLERGNGAFRQVFVTIDGAYVGSELPFPVIFTGGINPLLWEPVVAIGAFDLPSYDIDLTPLLGLLLDGNNHSFGLGVSDGIPFWLLDANLHLWLDPDASVVQAGSLFYQAPDVSVRRIPKYAPQLNGFFKTKAKGMTVFSGWVNSTAGNFTTSIKKKLKLKNSIKFKKNGKIKDVKQRISVKTRVMVMSDRGYVLSRATFLRKYPLSITTTIKAGLENNTYLLVTNISHSMIEKTSAGHFSSSVTNSQESSGEMVFQGNSFLSGSGNTQQTLKYRYGYSCYSRTVAASNGKLLKDNSTDFCAQPQG
ncbi:PREDICTED: peptide-N4-(N-acetyl-beta-glucosaminyl)asparagine amidase A-like [Nelumbo nucifera]|nr:PREDICTED: peptide-N4-(N-acetyl-beta-glucosaminyl)asparagine amidase A-like [Nelumbo nucifera]